MSVSATPQGWHILRLSNEVPPTPLFFLYDRSNKWVKLYVTDLIALWSTAFDQKCLVEESRFQKPSIDPQEQYDSFCVKLGESFTTGFNRIQKAIPDGSVDELKLSTKLQLPKPLKPLEWTFELRRDLTTFADQISISVLEALLQDEEHQRSLLKIIKEKDHVISKLLDKIEASGIDLGLIFPGISGSKSRKSQVSLKEASRHVPGIAAFDLTQWTKQNRKSAQESLKLTSLALTFADAYPDFDVNKAKLGITEALESAKSQKSTTQNVVLLDRSRSQTPEAQTRSRGTSSDFEDDPRSPAKQRQTTSTSKTAAEDSSSESDLDKASQRRQTHSGRSTLGILEPKRSDSPVTANTTRSKRTATSSSSSSSDSEHIQPPKTLGNKTISKLGKIGGRLSHKEQQSGPPPSKTASNASTTSRRLGMIGGRKTATPERRLDSALSHSKQKGSDEDNEQNKMKKTTNNGGSDDTASVSPSPSLKQTRRTDAASIDRNGAEKSLSPQPKSSAPEREPETEEEAAARRREDLKRTIQQNDKGKKKRKF